MAASKMQNEMNDPRNKADKDKLCAFASHLKPMSTPASLFFLAIAARSTLLLLRPFFAVRCLETQRKYAGPEMG